jgi:hypothetical protein
MTPFIRHGARDSMNSHLFFAWQATASSSSFALRARLGPGPPPRRVSNAPAPIESATSTSLTKPGCRSGDLLVVRRRIMMTIGHWHRQRLARSSGSGGDAAAPVDPDSLTGDVSGVLVQQHEDHMGDLCRSADPVQGNGIEETSFAF